MKLLAGPDGTRGVRRAGPRVVGCAERYHDPNCDSYPVVEGEKFTLVSFHRQLKKLSVEKVWMHTVVYGHIV